MFDFILVGSGVSGSFLAASLCEAGARCLVLEAGELIPTERFPLNERDANSRLFWSGGVELDSRARVALLRPKVVGGGSVVNQALLDRFDEEAWESWRARSGCAFFTGAEMAAWYDAAEKRLSLKTIPRGRWNRNAELFEEGFRRCGFRAVPLRRAQTECGDNDCIACLGGCPCESKQSTPVTSLRAALKNGLRLEARREVERIEETPDGVRVSGAGFSYEAKELILSAGAIGNTRLLQKSGFRLPALGRGFFVHPQYMTFARFADRVDAHKKSFQALKSEDPGFRRQGFKLENVFAPPIAIAMLIGGENVADFRRLACIEVAVRDTTPGTIHPTRIDKVLGGEDLARRDRGQAAVDAIFASLGAQTSFRGSFPVGLHLMGGCAIGLDDKTSVVDPEFRLHGSKRIRIADSSVFPDAPGINPSLTIMALSLKAAAEILKRKERSHAVG